MKEFVVVDIETTGLSAYRHKITEIAALKYHSSKLVDEFVTLINPEVRIPSFITRLTGINNDMVKDKPTIHKILPQLDQFMKGLPFIAHNATFDFNFIDFVFNKYLGKKLDNQKICTVRLARRLLPQLSSRKLSSLCSHFNLTNDTAHRARGDTEVTAIIFNKFLEMMKKKKIEELDDIVKFQSSKIPRLTVFS